jgi:hypothetical protein
MGEQYMELARLKKLAGILHEDVEEAEADIKKVDAKQAAANKAPAAPSKPAESQPVVFKKPVEPAEPDDKDIEDRRKEHMEKAKTSKINLHVIKQRVADLIDHAYDLVQHKRVSATDPQMKKIAGEVKHYHDLIGQNLHHFHEWPFKKEGAAPEDEEEAHSLQKMQSFLDAHHQWLGTTQSSKHTEHLK